MPQLNAILIPRQSLSSDQLRELENSWLEWLEAEQATGRGAFLDPGPVQDLLSGELPQPFALRAMDTGENEDKPLKSLLRDLGSSGSARIVRLGMNPLPPEGHDPEQFVDGLRLCVSAELTDRIIVEDESFEP